MAQVTGGELISGRLGGRVYRNFSGEGFVSAAPVTVNPRTQKQMDARARLALAVHLWQTLPLDAMDRWRAYAADADSFPLDRARQRARRGDLVFRGLAAKYLQVHGGSIVPTEPPTSAFLGDGVVVSVNREAVVAATSVVACSAVPRDSGAGTEPAATGPSDLGLSGVVFTALSPNSPGVLTELLLQRLAARHRMPHPEDYRTQRFVALEAGSLSATVECPAGAYACAIRFVRAATGQETPIVPLGVIEVG